ncbi:glycosyltransferase family 2 protein [cf. Phormidesmis sp. LEGE 11477]|uniref:glycosyltransferase family 2 protein n=1 Tax=cf. Phormidesmis sp. LEGE 11477 TaxID=1828680 RepID=UPI00187F6348|nr:glycosyltransferase [cf. Phormidesmis sp. LEGE 11477]MBE9062045.1 glycosyltransferase [cf. Phormidesmis sp. LEGE 11477]
MMESYSEKKPALSIVIPVHNGGESFRKSLISISKWRADAEVIIVADGESDGSWKLVEEYGFKLILLPECGGPARARNIGARAASADLLFFTDADVEIHPVTVPRIIYAFQESSELTALIGSYDDSPGAENFLSQYKNLFHHYTHQTSSEAASTFWGACGAIRKDVFLSLGGFTESYQKPCIEDIELGYRLRQAGHQITLCKHVQVKHLKRWTPFTLLRAEVFYRALPWIALLLKIRQDQPQQYQRFASDLNLQWSSRLSVVLIAGLCLSILFSMQWPFLIGTAVLSALLLLTLNWSVYRFFYRKRGFWFALGVVPWHWLYYFYSGLAFIIGVGRHNLTRRRSARQMSPT